MSRILDFDRARAEKKNPTVLRAFGGDYHIPSGPPVGFTLLVSRISESKGADDPYTEEEIMDLLEYAVGRDTFQALLGHGIDYDDAELLISMVGALWRGDDAGEADAPAEGAGSDT